MGAVRAFAQEYGVMAGVARVRIDSESQAIEMRLPLISILLEAIIDAAACLGSNAQWDRQKAVDGTNAND
jgi:hypothetical protein